MRTYLYVLTGILFFSCGDDDSDRMMMDGNKDMMQINLGSWSLGPSIPTARKEIANATVVAENKIYVLGGVEQSGSISNKLEIYDIESGSWTAGSSIPKSVWRASAAVQNGTIYLFGGYQSLNPFPFNPSIEVYKYTIATDSWEQVSNMPIARGASSAVALGDKIHLVGGANTSALSRMDIYTPATDSWETAPSMSVTRSGLTAIAVDNKIYAFGGYDLSAGVVSKSSAEVFDNGNWSSIANMSVERLGIDAAVINGVIYVMGGSSSSAQTNLSYTISTNSWTELASMPTPVSFMGVVSANDKVYAIGGGPENLNRTDAVSNVRIFEPPSE